MTDKEIIQSFLDNNQHGIREAYTPGEYHLNNQSAIERILTLIT